MIKHTFGIATVLLTLGTAALGQISSGLPDTPSAPGPHDDAVSTYNDQNKAENNSQSTLLDTLGTVNAASPGAHQYDQAVSEYRNGKLDSASRDLQAVLKLEPGSAPAHKLLAYTFLRQNKPADALPHLEDVVKAAPRDVQTRDNLGKVYLVLKRPADAAAQFKAVLSLSPQDSTALQGLAQTQPASGSTAAKGPKTQKGALSAQDYAKQGAALLQAHKFDEAMDAYNKAAGLDPKNADLRLYIGEQYARAGMPDKAIPAIDQALTLGTKHVFEAHTMLGQLYAAKDAPRAISEFKLAAEAKPSDPAAWYNLGVLHAQAGDSADARQDYQKVLDLKPADATLADHAKQNLAALGK